MPDKKRSWWRSGTVKEAVQPRKPLLPPIPPEIFMPEGIDFSVLWKDEEPDTSQLMLYVLLGIALFLNIVILLVVIFKHG